MNQPTPQTPPRPALVQNDPELKRYLRNLGFYNRLDQVIFRGCVTGMFTAIGVLLGTGVIFFIGTRLLSNLQEIPLINTILEQTRLDVVIENEVRRLSAEQTAGEEDGAPTTAEDEQVEQVKFVQYIGTEFGIVFAYPDYFTADEISETQTAANFTDDFGPLATLDISTEEPLIIGSSYQRFVSTVDFGRIVVSIYEEGATYSGEVLSNALFAANIELPSGDMIYLVGIANSETPKLARELFLQIVESVSEV